MTANDWIALASLLGAMLGAFVAGFRKGKTGRLFPRARFYVSIRPDENDDNSKDAPP